MNYPNLLKEQTKVLKLINERNDRLIKMGRGKRPDGYFEARLDNAISDVTYIKENICLNP